MSKLISFKHVANREAIPAEMVEGCVYFVESDGVIIINHGNANVVEYGNTTALQNQIHQLEEEKNYLKDLLTWKSGEDVETEEPETPNP